MKRIHSYRREFRSNLLRFAAYATALILLVLFLALFVWFRSMT